MTITNEQRKKRTHSKLWSAGSLRTWSTINYTKTWKHYYYSLVYIIVELWGESAVTYIYGKKSFLVLLSGIKIDWNKLKIKIMLREACQNLQCGRRVEATIDFSDRHLR
jgi:hypothetical protein